MIAEPDPPPAVAVHDLRKTFLVPHESHTSFKARAVELFTPTGHTEHRALDGVSFDVPRGEFVGIVGRNGSGKSTLLKCVAGIYEPDSGTVTVGGRVSPVVESGVGFRNELSAYDNVLLSGTILGLTRRQVEERLDDILAFADLEDFGDVKLKNLSSGMRTRLGFSLAVQVDADILLLDEVLAVGDEAFQEKCYAHFEAVKSEGRTVLFVGHDMDEIRRFCDRAVLLEAGRVAADGDPDAVAEAYHELNVQHGDDAGEPSRPPVRGRAFSGPRGPATYRPSAMGDDARALLRLTLALARAEFKLHYQGSVLGYAWSVMQPLMLFGVLYLVFTRVGRFDDIENYALYVLAAVVLWTYFTEATGNGVPSLVRAENMLRKLRFPRMAIPLAISLKALFNLLLNWLVVVVFALASGVTPRLSWLELPLLFGVLVTFATGFVMLLSSLYVRYRDTQQIWRVVERLLFFGSPIFYAASRYPDDVRELLAMTPLVMVFSEMRHAFIDPDAPSAAALAGGSVRLLVPVAIALAVFALGLFVFNRQAPRIAERV